MYISSLNYHKCLITAEKGFLVKLLANYSFLSSDVTRQADWKGGEGRRLERAEGERGLLSDLIKGHDYVIFNKVAATITRAIPHAARVVIGAPHCLLHNSIGFCAWPGTCVPQRPASKVIGL